jgi:hypothetical protein
MKVAGQLHITILFSSSFCIDRDKRVHRPSDCDCCLQDTSLEPDKHLLFDLVYVRISEIRYLF